MKHVTLDVILVKEVQLTVYIVVLKDSLVQNQTVLVKMENSGMNQLVIIVVINVLLVLVMLTIVLLVVKKDLLLQLVIVIKDIMKLMKFVLLVMLNVPLVPMPQDVLNVLLIEIHQLQNVHVQMDHTIVEMDNVQFVTKTV